MASASAASIAAENRREEHACFAPFLGDLVGDDGAADVTAAVETRRCTRHGDRTYCELVADDIVISGGLARAIERNLEPVVRRTRKGGEGRLRDGQRAHRAARPHHKAVLAGLPQDRHSAQMIDVGIGEEHPGDWRAAVCGRMQRREGFDLAGDVRRAVEQEPSAAVSADRQARLRASWLTPIARRGAVRARAVPLRHPAAGSRAENANDHARRATSAPSSSPSRSAVRMAWSGLNEQAGSVAPASPASR